MISDLSELRLIQVGGAYWNRGLCASLQMKMSCGS
jgi:non-ribosomal peptide synthetase component E (peptide arylation enzyme)